MKKQNLTSKLSIKKQSISNLELQNVQGGAADWTWPFKCLLSLKGIGCKKD